MTNTVLVVGATGVVGQACLRHFAALPGWRAVGVARRAIALPAGATALQLDLQDAAACQAALSRADVSANSPDQTSNWSPSSTAMARPNSAGSPTPCWLRCQSSNCRWAAGSPRRKSEASITSSCTSADTCSTSRDAAAFSTASGTSRSPDTADQPHAQNAGRSRFPPAVNATARE